jgi:hypothetical protein
MRNFSKKVHTLAYRTPSWFKEQIRKDRVGQKIKQAMKQKLARKNDPSS